MRILRVAGMLIALVAALVGAVPVAADDSAPSVDLTVGWASSDNVGGGSGAGQSWIPFTVVMSVPAGHGDWTGSLVIRPKASAGGGCYAYGCGGFGVTYQQPVTVRPGGARTLTVYGQYEANGPAPTYEALLVDAGGATYATSSTSALRPNSITLGVLSDAPSADSLFHGVAVGQSMQVQQVRGHRFDKSDPLPGNALALTGLHALVIDDFDTATLSQAQLRALVDYVGFGGTLIVTGGSNWRRTLAQLPATLVPIKPDSTGTASMSALSELIGGSSEVSVAVATGVLAVGARILLADAAGTPLLAESSYGAGRVVEVMYDPALEPLIGSSVGIQAWSAVLNRAISSSRLAVNGPVGPAPVPMAGGAGVATGVPTGPGGVTSLRYGAGEAQIFAALANSPASAIPPLTLLGSLLVGYVILVGPANYLLVRRRRRELMWVTLPLLAVLFTGIAYGAGMAYKGSDFLVNQIQLVRLAPGGVADATMLNALFNSRRGDFVVLAPDGSFATTSSSGGQYGPLVGGPGDRVNPGRRPTVALNQVPVWGERNVKVEAAVKTGINLEAHLGIAAGRVRGTISNRGVQPVRDLALLTVSGEWAVLVAAVQPGATATVDSALGAVPAYSTGNPCNARANPCLNGGAAVCSTPVNCKGVVAPAAGSSIAPYPQPYPAVTGPLSESAQVALAEIAAAASVMVRSDVQALVGTVDPLAGISIRDQNPTFKTVAALAEPIVLESIDRLPGGWAAAQLVTSVANSQAGTSLNVWDFIVPGRVEGGLVLQYGTPGVPVPVKPGIGPNPQSPVSVDIYDWTTRTWSRLAADARCPASSNSCATLTAGQVGDGMVRIRVRNSPFYNFQVQLLSASAVAT